MRVRELVEWLQAFEDQEDVVCVVVSEPGTGYFEVNGTTYELATYKYDRVEDNISAIARFLFGIRMQAITGVATFEEQMLYAEVRPECIMRDYLANNAAWVLTRHTGSI